VLATGESRQREGFDVSGMHQNRGAIPKKQAIPMKLEPQKEHEWLQRLVGEWTYESECSMEPGKPCRSRIHLFVALKPSPALHCACNVRTTGG